MTIPMQKWVGLQRPARAAKPGAVKELVRRVNAKLAHCRGMSKARALLAPCGAVGPVRVDGSCMLYAVADNGAQYMLRLEQEAGRVVCKEEL